MTVSRPFNDPRRLFDLWKELTGEDLMPTTESTDQNLRKNKEENKN